MFRRFPVRAIAALAIGFPGLVLADLNGTLTLAANTALNLDTGITASSGGDLLWTGNSMTFLGSAKGAIVPGVSGDTVFAQLTPENLQPLKVFATTMPIPAASLPIGSILGVLTNGGNVAKVLVTVASGTSITLKFTTFGAVGTPTPPAITKVQNNYSFIVPGLPNYGIAPGSLFIIVGTGLSDPVTPVLQSSAAPGLPLSLNGSSVSVTVNANTANAPLYYTSATQLAALLPSNTPLGMGTITVTYKGQTSGPAPIKVVSSALGIDTLYGTGTGIAVATDSSGNLIGLSNSATPGQTITVWGSGVGADAANDDKTFPLKQNNLTNIPMQVYIGGIPANILYRGRSQYPGVDQVNVIVPQGVQPGCSVSVAAVSGDIVSNFATLPIAPGGVACSDPVQGISAGLLQTLSGKANVKVGSVSLFQATSLGAIPTTGNLAGGAFQIVPGAQYGAGNGSASFGSCIVLPVTPTKGLAAPPPPVGLDAGPSLTLTGSGGTQQLPQSAATGFGLGLYSAQFPAAFVPASGGAFTFTGTGGRDVGRFSVTVNLFNSLVWSNASSISGVDRSRGLAITWTGGAAGSYVSVTGSSTAMDGGPGASFVCTAPASAGELTVPLPVMLALPAGMGLLSISNFAQPITFAAPGLDYTFASSSVQISKTLTFQ